ncbi:Citrate lyase beta subunit-like [Acididesulfobacillus acetoxydans]|uniref:Citrate lyase beta subunit-like n=1 Tax=Acididesulfobacillus acetoxydans TaxID=1561005 RepID=A0A8S0WZH4_9FIRM|nr:CoA ester lyase [Acididesulfobacillus acetoxydans]CAA7601951.1 Citrate lyase beta subunit-like [Acididesulfobacillus acetoxydans]CEJ08205.1 Citrate lyase subunit beta [Acididesulfobacillus acetoxydans]
MQKNARSMYFVSGNEPKMLQNAPVFDPDSIVIDLARRVPATEKDSARILVKEALRFLDYSNVEVIVRINPLSSEYGLKDVKTIAPVKPYAFMIPKARAEDIQALANLLSEIEKAQGFEEESIKLIPMIDNIVGLESVHSTINASSRVTAAFLNAEDLAADYGSKRTKEGDEILYARSKVSMACRAAGIEVIDTPYMDINDSEGLEMDTEKANLLGFTGKAAIDGRQVETINIVFDASLKQAAFPQTYI